MRSKSGVGVLVLVGMFLAGGCGGPPERAAVSGTTVAGAPASGERISVVEFDGKGARVKYDEPTDALGLALASEIAAELRRRGHTADVVSASATPPAGTVVRGRITVIDGGSRAARLWVGFGAGGATFGADGDVTRADGTRLGSFRDERLSSGMANMWGGSAHDLIQKCVRTVGHDIAEMIDTGHYRQ